MKKEIRINGITTEVWHVGANESFLTGGTEYDRLYSEPPPVSPRPIPPPPVSLAQEIALPERTCDTECYRNYWLAGFTDDATGQDYEFEVYPGSPPLDAFGLHKLLTGSRLITFNGFKYDVPMMFCALAGFNNSQLKDISDAIIKRNLFPWQVEKEFGIRIPQLDHIDLFDVAPGAFTGLKEYGGRVHSRRIQDLPIEPDALITPEQRAPMRQYCKNDRDTTRDLRVALREQIEMRVTIGKLYDLELRSKSDAQISEMVFKKRIGFDVVRPYIPHNTQFMYTPPAYVSFQTPALRAVLDMLARSPFTVSDKDDAGEEIDDNGVKIKTGVIMSRELKEYKIAIGKSVYQMGMGGLHSTEKSVYYVTDAEHVLEDDDVVSYYPRIIINNGYFPKQYGPGCIAILADEVDTRVRIKSDPARKVESNGRKIIVNAFFGKTGSKWSTLFAPDLMVQTTITGQLSLLMLIEVFELNGIPVVSANTDGVVTHCPVHLIEQKKAIIKWWEGVTGFQTENTQYRAVFSRDVNNYIAFKLDGTVKTKGSALKAPEMAGDKIKPDLAKNPTGAICVEAVIAYLGSGVPIEQTIMGCKDVRKFVHTRKVKGGGVKGDQYLGKVVRWYYRAGEYKAIYYATSGNQVAGTMGAWPMMELADEVPKDIDYVVYIKEAYGMLSDLGLRK